MSEDASAKEAAAYERLDLMGEIEASVRRIREALDGIAKINKLEAQAAQLAQKAEEILRGLKRTEGA